MPFAQAIRGRRRSRGAKEARKPGHPPPEWYLNPGLHLAINCILMTVAELCLQVGAKEASQADVPTWLAWTGLRGFVSLWTIAGIVVYIVAFANWLYVLRWVPLSVAYPLTTVVQVLVAIAAWLFLGEHVPITRWIGILLISGGVLLSAKPAAQAEEKL
ncbi:MAG TPA: DMT family transporter [Planctomycetota bacterium]|jgi:drug/metabolite transporter (DMT)-like permease|nr:DMT family transporter [Planctomycetota bacterium]